MAVEPSSEKKTCSRPGGASSHQLARQLDGRHVSQPQHGAVRDPVQLVAEGGIQLRHTMAVDIAPQRGNTVDVPPTFDIDQEAPFRLLDDQLAFRGVSGDRSEGMPDVVAVPLLQLSGRRAPGSSFLAVWVHERYWK